MRARKAEFRKKFRILIFERLSFADAKNASEKEHTNPSLPPAFCVPSSTAPFGAAHFQKTKSVQLSSLYTIAILAKVIEVILGLKLIGETKGTKLG